MYLRPVIFEELFGGEVVEWGDVRWLTMYVDGVYWRYEFDSGLRVGCWGKQIHM